MRRLLPLAGLVALASMANAQQLIVPLNQSFACTGQTTAGWRSTLFHFQIVYDPTLGLDLNIDVNAPSAPTPNPTSMIATATSSVLATHKAQRLATGTAGALTGTLSGFAAIVLLGYSGPGGYPVPTGARVDN